MTKVRALLNQYNYSFQELVPNKAFNITPRTMRYEMNIVLIVQDEDREEFTMMLWIDDEMQKEIKVKYRANIYSSYDYLFILGVRLIDNRSKTRKNESNQNTERIS